MRACMFKRFDKNLRALAPDPALNSSALVAARLAVAQRPLGCGAKRSRFVFIPAAVGGEDGWMLLDSPPQALIRGGSMSETSVSLTVRNEYEQTSAWYKKEDYLYRVRTTDVASWIFKMFKPADYVVIKMDVEGGEFGMMPKLLRLAGGLGLVDRLAMQCHKNKAEGRSCKQLLASIGRAAKKVGFREVDESSYDGMDSHSRPPNRTVAGAWARACGVQSFMDS